MLEVERINYKCFKGAEENRNEVTNLVKHVVDSFSHK